MHPRKAARAGAAGWVGELNPELAPGEWGVFELDLGALSEVARDVVVYEDVISYPAVKQDLSFVVADEVQGKVTLRLRNVAWTDAEAGQGEQQSARARVDAQRVAQARDGSASGGLEQSAAGRVGGAVLATFGQRCSDRAARQIGAALRLCRRERGLRHLAEKAFRSALAASGLEACGTSRSASPTRKTFRFPMAGRIWALRCSTRTSGRKIPAIPSGGAYSGCSRRAWTA